MTGSAATSVSSRMSGCWREHLVAEVGDVLARVAALGHAAAVQPGQHGVGEDVHLRAGVVDVVLGRDVRAGGPEHARDRVAQGGPAGVADVQRPGGVGGDELHVDACGRRARCWCRRPVPASTMALARAPAAAASTVMFRKPGPAMSTAETPSIVLQPGAEDGGELPRVGAGRLGQLQGDVGGPVSVVPVLRPLHAHLVRDVGSAQGDFTGGDGVLQAGGYGEGEFFWGHASSLPGAREVEEFKACLCGYLGRCTYT